MVRLFLMTCLQIAVDAVDVYRNKHGIELSSRADQDKWQLGTRVQFLPVCSVLFMQILIIHFNKFIYYKVIIL